MEIVSKCPFLSRVSSKIFASSRGAAIFDAHAPLCPVFSRTVSVDSRSVMETTTHQNNSDDKKTTGKFEIPFPIMTA